MRTWGRVYDANNNPSWIEVTTDSNGFNDAVWLTTLIQVLLLNQGESPFNANYGIPAEESVMYQIYPDMQVQLTQQQFAQYFASLTISKVSNVGRPYYNISVITHLGAKIAQQVPI